MVESETVKDDGTVVRRCVGAGLHVFGFIRVLSFSDLLGMVFRDWCVVA